MSISAIFSVSGDNPVTCYYSPTTLELNDSGIANQIAFVLSSYHWELQDGTFLVIVPDTNVGESVQTFLVDSGIVLPRNIVYLTNLDTIHPDLDPILVVDTMIRTVNLKSTFGGHEQTQQYTSKEEADRYLSLSKNICHRMCTREFSTLLPDTNGDEKRTDENTIGPRLQAILNRWIGAGMEIFPMLSLVSILERFQPALINFPLSNHGEVPSQYRLMTLSFTKKQHLPFAGRDQVETLLNLWKNLLHTLQTDTINGSINGSIEDSLGNYTQVGEWCRLRGIALEPMMSICSLVLDNIHRLRMEGYPIIVNEFNVQEFYPLVWPYFEQEFQDRIMLLETNIVHPTYLLGTDEYWVGSIIPSFLELLSPPRLVGLVLDRFKDSNEITLGMVLDPDLKVLTWFTDRLNNPPNAIVESIDMDDSLD